MIQICKSTPALLVLFLLLGAGTGSGQIHIEATAVTRPDWTADQIQSQLAADVHSVDYKSRGANHTFTCVPLIALLRAAGVETNFVMNPGANPKTKNPLMRRVIIVTARDGYSVVFSMPEVLPMIGNRPVWVALQEDGKPLAENDGPIRLIVPDDGMPARGVHQVASITVTEVNPSTTEP